MTSQPFITKTARETGPLNAYLLKFNIQPKGNKLVVKKVYLKITPHFKFAVQYSTVQYSTVQYNTVLVLLVFEYKLELNKIYFILFKKSFY